MLLDGPAVMMLFVVTLVSLLVHVYSTDYVGGDRRYTHFFAFLSLFTASMLGLVMAKTTLQLIVVWELVGVCSFVLIGHWWEEKANSDAALKAFITNRVGDVGLIVGVIMLFLPPARPSTSSRSTPRPSTAPSATPPLLVASCCLVGRGHVEVGPVHPAHVAARRHGRPDAGVGADPRRHHGRGRHLHGRAPVLGVLRGLLASATSSVNLLAVVGGVTVLGGAGLAFVQNDIKKVLAYSTVSQLGYMVMALGVGAWTAAFFHLFTHAFFKACLFLGSGSVSHAVHSFDMKKDMGGLRKWMPQTYKTFIIATAALIGIFPLAGFWSKDEILAGASQLGGAGHYTVFMVVGIVGALMTAAYMTRVIYLTFFGEFRGHGHPHESGPRITVPLWILAVLGVSAGLVNLPAALGPDALELRFEHYFEPKGAYFPVENFAHPEFSLGIALGATAHRAARHRARLPVVLAGPRPARHHPAQPRRPRPATRCSSTSTTSTTSTPTSSSAAIKGPIARAVYWFNQNVIDGVVNGAGRLSTVVGPLRLQRASTSRWSTAPSTAPAAAAESGGQVFRQLTSGKVQQYGALLFGAAALFAGAFIIFV